ncbi:MAG: pectate lyase [Candidatus Dactylopiibacterium carminicum]|uniref:Pectate lyase n=1 Tax=Candidatus Dactylopiibacterium carminicum TaxID=857335 RepID=A0A272EU38_9RHOO|nr:pectate lyase [Candidatus Dactylopiibacterium carminicum]PAS93260.1 MAG: pectate lyase [Candidatus Dactylopiibacterium carminicum]PAS99182.1 MAG: hypothetical protein BSR46_09315 [Candidatus Dactylopiibacterium carminicum]
MRSKIVMGLLALAMSAGVHAATDYPSGYTKCVKEGETCSMSGTRSVAFGKSGTFVYATLTGSFTCQASLFPSNSISGTRWCSYSGSSTSSSASSSSSSSQSSSSSSSSSSSGSGSSKCVAGASFTNETVDCGGKTVGLSCKGDDEGQPAVFTLNNATVKNMRIAANGGSDGIHCVGGNCVLENVVWEDICEDAASIPSVKYTDVTMHIKGGSAYNSASSGVGGKPDKIFQNNGVRATVKVTNGFTALGEHGKLSRSCGDCTSNSGPRYFVIDGAKIDAKIGSILGVNRNYGDKATIRNLQIKGYKSGSPTVCEEWKGIQKGSGSTEKYGEFWNTQYCDVSKSDVTSF